jgi:hypothetical protein
MVKGSQVLFGRLNPILISFRERKKPEIIILFFAIEFSRMQCKGYLISPDISAL